MGEAVEDPRDVVEFAELPDLYGAPLSEILDSDAPVLMKAQARVVAEARSPQITAAFGSFIE